ncbi:pseudouridine-5'-phosphate glycosidase [Variovorax sp. PCZ-1]|uniref:pseudouridine-5'-phosphate glycosidase n=1 Tax=Variovorax sp. PCZ-1 TaxID=2835533 RepID=UPI0020BE032D|nr:pseudouridine-5'-phosphate glycosidase [Variovorax sp. PCZ-1]
MQSAKEHLNIHPEVAQALADGRAVVALESTIIAHGMPYPQNVATALEVEAVIRAHGAIPATIAVLEGKICVGLSREQIEVLGSTPDVMKLSRRDLPYAVATGKPGATTVAATMICAALAGIPVFVTGGIGGVHRGAAESFDISADLTELAQTPVAVVCAGAKSILDLPLTLEVLETNGVPVISIGQENFAAFFTRDSGLKADFRIDEPELQARFIRAKWAIGLKGGVLISNPVPAQSEIPAAQINQIIDAALQEATAQGISGKRVTPYLLKRINELTQGASLKTNIALVKNNARVGAQLAVALTITT